MSFTVLNVAYPFAAVGPDAVGGAEQVLSQLDAALVRAGHRSIVVAAEGSRVQGTLQAVPAIPGPIADAQRSIAWAEHRRAIRAAVARHAPDVIHLHGVDFAAYLPPPGAAPLLATLHLPPSWYPAEIFSLPREDVHLHCVSHAQHAACPPGARLLPPVPNGVPVQALDCRVHKRRYAIALGRICPEKNLHVALEAGRLANFPVLLGGAVFPYQAHQQYYWEHITPRLDRERLFLGPLDFARKRRLLAGARCLLLPTLAPETSSLVAMEALACGTPVVAYPSGAIPEMVDPGVTGFLVRDAAEMAAAIAACAQLDPERCRAVARERFTLERMVARYFDVYRQLARRTQHDVAADATR
ncbi:glycosyltransferase [Ramlibacter alkalitolerans]|uniref:Glycosyltransferase n=1 Tax=Ramlibacter alkalitolerans TaxID=2039631 RepID=A0ABS1JV93_9BURK|nr:glycosyltransferase [Ramlibacter alkalitolerans]